MRRGTRRANLTLRWLLIAAVLCLPVGCAHLKRRPAGQKAWWQKILPPKGEFFFDERSHDIERNLSRDVDVSAGI